MTEEEFSPPRMKSMLERPKDVVCIHDEYFGVGVCADGPSFDQLEKTQGSKWRKKKGEKASYKPREDKQLSRLKMLAYAVKKVREERDEDEVATTINEWQTMLEKKGLAPLITYLQNEGMVKRGKSRKKKGEEELEEEG